MNGEKTYAGHSLHSLEAPGIGNLYLSAITSSVRFLRTDADQIFPLLYFGSAQANSAGGVLHVGNCGGVEGLRQAYTSTIGEQTLSGPTSFVPLIRWGIEKVKETGHYHILLILTDGCVTDPEEHYPVLDEASNYPLSIVCVGIGDGPFDEMARLDDKMSSKRKFDNFQFVEYQAIRKQESPEAMAKEFFFHAFMEIPKQYEQIKERLNYKQVPRGVSDMQQAP